MATNLKTGLGGVLDTLAHGWHDLERIAATVADDAAQLTPLAAKVMGLVGAGSPLSAGAEAILMELVDIFHATEQAGGGPINASYHPTVAQLALPASVAAGGPPPGSLFQAAPVG